MSTPFGSAGTAAACAGVLEPIHARDKIAGGRLDEELVMIAHENPRPDPEVGALTTDPQGLQEKRFIATVGRGKDPVAAIPASHEVVESDLIFNPDLPWHEGRTPPRRALSKTEIGPCPRFPSPKPSIPDGVGGPILRICRRVASSGWKAASG